MNVNDLVRVRIQEVTDQGATARFLYSNQQGILLPNDITRRTNFRQFVRPGRNEVVRIKSIEEDGRIYLSKNTVSPEEIYEVEGRLYQ